MNYIKVDEKDKDAKMQDIFRYMPMLQMYNGKMIQIIAKEGNNVYYVE